MGAAEAAAEVLIVYLSIPNLLPPNKKGRMLNLTEVHISSVFYTQLSEDFLIHIPPPYLLRVRFNVHCFFLSIKFCKLA